MPHFFAHGNLLEFVEFLKICEEMEMIQFNDSLNFIPVVMQLFVCKLQIFLCKWQKDFCYFIKGNDMLFDVQKRLNSTTIEL